ncbi:MAG: RIP metalloprotease RseP [Bacteroidales bacterium]
MNILIMIAQLILGLSILIFFHELGHFLVARLFGIRVDKFYLFFDAGGFKLFSFKKGDTEYGIGWLPLGGYCKIAGMIDESLDKDAMKSEPKPWEYRSKPAYQRFLVIIAGVTMNLIIGIFIFAALLFQMEKNYLPISEVNKQGIYAGEIAKEVGFQDGDKILEVNGKTIERFKDAIPMKILLGGNLTIERAGLRKTILIPDSTYKKMIHQSNGLPFLDAANYPLIVDTTIPNFPAEKAGLKSGDRILAVNNTKVPTFGFFRQKVKELKNDSIHLIVLRQSDTLLVNLKNDSTGYIGILSVPPYQYKHYTLSNSLYYGTKDAFDLIITNVKGLGKIFTGKEKASESLQGPIGIATIYGPVWNWGRFWYITGMISLVLAFMNILPIPGLDGGHMVFTLYEMISRRKPSDNFLEKSQMVGMALLLALMFFAIGNDIFRLLK